MTVTQKMIEAGRKAFDPLQAMSRPIDYEAIITAALAAREPADPLTHCKCCGRGFPEQPADDKQQAREQALGNLFEINRELERAMDDGEQIADQEFMESMANSAHADHKERSMSSDPQQEVATPLLDDIRSPANILTKPKE